MRAPGSSAQGSRLCARTPGGCRRSQRRWRRNSRGKVCAVGRPNLVDATGADRGGVGGINGVVRVAHDAEVQARLAGLALAQPDARSDSGGGYVGVVAETVKVRDGARARGGVVLTEFTPAEGLECLEVEGQRLLNFGDRDVDVLDQVAASLHAAAFLPAKSRNVRGGVPVICSPMPLGCDPLPYWTVSVSGRSTASYSAATPFAIPPAIHAPRPDRDA